MKEYRVSIQIQPNPDWTEGSEVSRYILTKRLLRVKYGSSIESRLYVTNYPSFVTDFSEGELSLDSNQFGAEDNVEIDEGGSLVIL